MVFRPNFVALVLYSAV